MGTYEKLISSHAERINKISNEFLRCLPDCRTDRKALIKSGLSKNMLRKLKNRDQIFISKYREIHREIELNRLCRKCGVTFTPEKHRKNSVSFSVCIGCSTKYYNMHLDNPEARVKRIIASASTRGECSLKPNRVIKHLDSTKWVCSLSGVVMTTESGPDCVSPDRIVSHDGYSVKNVQFVRRRVNLMRGMLKLDEFIHLCNLVSNPVIYKSKVFIDEKLLKESARKLIRDITRRKKPCNISIDNIITIVKRQNGVCFYTGLPMKIEKGRNDPCQVSIDRKNSSEGYLINNVVACRLDVNRMKYDMSTETFISECDRISSMNVSV
jgi:hypothetical protein